MKTEWNAPSKTVSPPRSNFADVLLAQTKDVFEPPETYEGPKPTTPLLANEAPAAGETYKPAPFQTVLVQNQSPLGQPMMSDGDRYRLGLLFRMMDNGSEKEKSDAESWIEKVESRQASPQNVDAFLREHKKKIDEPKQGA